MRPLGWLVLALIVAGFVWAVGWGPLREVSLLQLPQEKGDQAASAPTAPEPEETTAAKPAPVRRSRARDAASVATDTASAPPEQPLIPAAAPPPPKKFPTSADLPLGMLGSSIQAAFGPPVAKTISVDQSGRIEVFIYRRNNPDSATFVHLRNSRVISASTAVY